MLKEEKFKDVVFATDVPGAFLAMDDDILFYENPIVRFRPGGLPWRTQYLLLAICRGGWMAGRIDMVDQKMKEGDCLLLQPTSFVEVTGVSPDFKSTVIAVSPRFAKSLNFGDNFKDSLSYRQSPCFPIGPDAHRIINTYFQCMKPLLAEGEAFTYKKEIARLMSRALILSLASLPRFVPDLKETNRQANLVLSFVNLVKENYREHREMDFYAERMCLTAKYITAVVKAQSGRSATDWIERYVILDAQSMLGSTDMTVLQISQKLHFPSQSFFGKYFKRVTGMSPKDYRRAARNFAL